MFKPYKFSLEKKKNLNKVEKANFVTKIEIAKMIDQINKQLLGVVIPETPLANKSSKIQSLDKVLEMSFDGEDKKLKPSKL